VRWHDLTIKTEDGSQTTVAAMAKRRLVQDKTFGYLGYSVSNNGCTRTRTKLHAASDQYKQRLITRMI